MIEITNEDFSVNEIVERMKSPEIGCVVTFVGTVRSTSPQGPVETVEIESYTEMAREKLSELVEHVKKYFEIADVSIIHRVGKLEISENIVCIAVSAVHRKDAFKACEWLINELKKCVPIWKNEIFTKIVENTRLVEILKSPEGSKILAKHNLPCLHCPMATYEIGTLKIGEVAKMYGINIKNLLKDLNKNIRKSR
ncbi:MAG: molybdenum cofactor biosynthesis protein MoaE [Candidatus Aerophobetes bacterium]|nr:molybdenum cofactor biosynthesis protein MoaE [Candidatus Aerophobetes bacterium]